MFITHWHPAADAFPFMQGDDFENFVEDIRLNGVLKPIEVYDGNRWPEFKKCGIDGRNRQRACQKLGIDPPVRKLTDADVGDSLTSYIASVNVARRHLSKSQAAVVALALEKHFAVENANKMAAGRAKGNRNSAMARSGSDEVCSPQLIAESKTRENRGNSDSNLCTFVEGHDGSQQSSESREQAAAAVGTNRQYVSYAKTIAKDSLRLLELVRSGDLVIPQAMSIVRLRKSNPEEVASFEKGQISLDEFRDRCFLKREYLDLCLQVQTGRIELGEAIAKAKQHKAAERKVKVAGAAEALAAANAKRRVKEAMKDLGEGASVDKIAARAGVDKQFADKVIREIPENEDALISSPKELVPRGEEVGRDETGALRYVAKKGEPTDRLNRPLDLEMVAAFSDLEEFEALIVLGDQFKARIDKLSMRPGGRYVNARVLTDQLQNVLDHLRKESPYCVCPSCGGFGWQDTKAQICRGCDGKAFMSEAAFARMTPAMQRVASGYK